VQDVLLPLRGSVLLAVLPMSFFSDRPLCKALGVSLGLHLVLLLGGLAFSPAEPELVSAPLRVVMGPAEKKAGTRPAAAAGRPVPPTPPAMPQGAGDSNGSLAAPARVSASQAGPEARQETRQETRQEGFTLPGGGVTGAAASREGLSADALRQYRMTLASATRRFKRYPPLARERGWEGTVEVALNVSSGRAVPEVVLMHSSGRQQLDAQALAMVSQAARVTPLPEGLAGRDFRVLLPVRFSLENEP
jgi:protein TonB